MSVRELNITTLTLEDEVMDNLVVGLTGATCFIMAQSATNWFDSITPLGIVAIVVYYFLWKFDKKLDIIEDTTRELETDMKLLIEKERDDGQQEQSEK